MRKRTLMYLQISAQNWKKEIGIQKQQTKKPNTRMIFKNHPPSCRAAAQAFLGRIRIRMRKWKTKRAKVILRIADAPKQAPAAAFSSSDRY